MPMRPPRTLLARLLLLLLAVAAGVWLGVAGLTWFEVRDELDELLDGHLAQAAALVVAQQAAEAVPDEHAREHLDAPNLHRYAPRVAFQVFQHGRLVLHSANAPAEPMAPAGRSGFANVRAGGTDWRVYTVQRAEGELRVHVGEQRASRAEILRAVIGATLLPMALMLPLLALAAGWAVYRGLGPLRQLGQALAARSPQVATPLELPQAPGEMQPLLAALNGLFERVAALVESERRFTADAAHELRTPIAAIRAQAQVALAETREAERARALQATLAGCDRATHLVEQLLTLARLEAAGAPAAASPPVELAALARQVVAELAPQALARQQALAVEALQPVTVAGDTTLLAVLLRNLVDNAIRYSPPGAPVQVAVKAQGGQACLEVADGGPGLAEDDRQRLGERFFRVLGQAAPGSGLGWSIVRRVAAVHGASIAVERSPALGGLQVTVRLPLAR